MKESIGSTMMLYVFLILFVVVISVMAITTNFAITFQRKNQIISILERSNGKASIYESDLNKFFKNKANSWKMVDEINNNYDGYKCKIAEKIVNNEDNRGKYYQIVVFVEFSFPLINRAMYFPINGETAVISIENTTTMDEPTATYTD